MAFTAGETTNIAKELVLVLTESMPTTKQVFLDGSTTYAANLVDFKAIVDTVTSALFDQTAPVIKP